MAAGFTTSDIPDLSGKCYLVTGANSGIGLAITRDLAMRGARVLMGCRSEKAALAAIRDLKLGSERDVSFLQLDLADLDSIRSVPERLAKEKGLSGLINNAGVMTPPLTRTTQGFELQFGVNHLAVFALTNVVLPLILDTPDSRVVVTSSISERGASIDWEDISAHKSYSRYKRYAASKLANLLFMRELSRRLEMSGSKILSVGCHPGLAATNLTRHMGPLKILSPIYSLLLNTAEMGAWPALQAATGNVQNGKYYGPQGFKGLRGPSGEAEPSEAALDVDQAALLWELSERLTGFKYT